MSKRALSGIMLTLLLTGMLTLAFNIQPVKAEPKTWYVDDDGGADFTRIQDAIYAASPGDTIVVSEGTYAEGQINVYKPLTLIANGTVIVDGLQEGHVFYVTASNVVIKWFEIQNSFPAWWYSGIHLDNAQNCTLQGNIVMTRGYGIALYNSDYNAIRENVVNVSDGSPPPNGVYLKTSNYNEILKNILMDNTGWGIVLEESNYTMIRENTAMDNGLGGIQLLNSHNNIIKGNTAKGGYYAGIQLGGSSWNVIEKNNATYSNWGIRIWYSVQNLVEANIADGNTYSGVDLHYSHGNLVKGNLLVNHDGYYGKGIEVDSSNNNTVVSNTVSNNKQSIYIWGSNNNTIYHNNFINSTWRSVGSELAANIWDGGYPSGGNYWSDYTGLDVDSDGIGDTSYIIDVNNVDRYPLMHPWSLLPVHNINTGLGYTKIQQAINANETLDWHTIFVEAGTYNENVFVNKTVRLIGESRIGTIIDGEIDVTANNVIISGFAIGGFTVFVSGKRMYFGIRLFGANCTVSNNTVFNTGTGVWLLNSTDNVISNNALLYNVPYSVYLSDSSNNTISQNYIGSIEWKGLILPLDYGIELYRSSNNTIIQNNVTQCRRAIRMEGVIPFGELQSDSSNNTIIENNIEHWEWGISVSQSTNNTMVGNNITCLSDPRLGESSGISLGRSHFNSIAQNIIESNYEGLKLVDSHFNNISQNNARYNIYGILLESSAFNLLCRNIITRNYYGILVRSGYSEYINMLRYNNMTENRYNFGVGYWYFQDVDETNTVDGKPVYYWINRHDGQIPLDAGYVAIVNSTDIRVEGLDLKNNYQGIFIAYSNNVTICQNNITDNYDGIWLVASSNNTIYHNNFINNQAYSYESVNVWDDVYPSGGNYWSDYVGVDVKRGPNQDLSGSDGIGDTPYIIDANNRDRYPLMNPYGAPPPLTYALTITTTVGGTTDPAPGTCSYTANSQVQVTAFLNTTTYLFDHWELDSVNVGSANPYTVLMDKNHMLKAVFSPIPAPLSASITPLSASILVSQSVTFTSTVSGGYTPYSYQWYLNGNPVSGATSNAWAFTPTTSGTYYAHLKVTDAKGNTAQSDTARIVVSTVPVGGYSIPIQVPATATPLTPYIILTAILTIAFTTIKCKTTKKTKKPP